MEETKKTERLTPEPTLFAQAVPNAEPKKEETKVAQEPDYSTWNIFRKMAHAKNLIQHSVQGKSGKNDYSGFSYAELKDFMPVTLAVFDKLGIFSKFVIETPKPDENGIVDEKAVLKIINVDNPQEQLIYTRKTAECVIKGASPIQNQGGVDTYMRRYLYTAALDLAVADAIDKESGSGKVVEDTHKTKPTAAQIASILKGDPQRVQNALAYFGVQRPEDLSREQASVVIAQLKKPLKEQKKEPENVGTDSKE